MTKNVDFTLFFPHNSQIKSVYVGIRGKILKLGGQRRIWNPVEDLRRGFNAAFKR